MKKGVLAFCGAIALLMVTGTPTWANTMGFSLGSAANYGVLYEGNGGNTLNYNNSDETGATGIGNTGKFKGDGPGTITGSIYFSAANTGQFSNNGLTITGSINYGVSDVSSALGTVNSLSQTLGLEAGTSTTISSGGSASANSGVLDGNGNRIFTVSSISFPNGTFAISGAASDYLVFNIAGGVGNNGLNGSVVLSGGITSDHVLFNFTPDTLNLTTYNNDYTALSGGPTMTISTSGLTTTGVFLDPTGDFTINHSNVNGRIFGGDTKNSAFVSGGELTAPVAVPLPSAAWGGAVLLCVLLIMRKVRSARHPTAV